MRLNYPLLVAICCCLWLPCCTYAQSTVWNGSVSTDWFTPENWSDGLPTTGKDAIINDPTLALLPVIDQVLNVDFTITNTARIHNQSTIHLLTEGVLNNFTTGRFINDGTFINEGQIAQQGEWHNHGELLNQRIFTNSGRIDNSADAQLINVGTLVNNGDMRNDGRFFNQGNWSNHSNTINTAMLINQGRFEISFGSQFHNTSTANANNGDYFEISGTLLNNGVIRNEANCVISSSGTLNNEHRIVNEQHWSNSGTWKNAGDFINQEQFVNEFGESQFDNMGNATNANCALFIQRSNRDIQQLLNNGIVHQVDGATVQVLDASTGVLLRESTDVAAPTVRVVSSFSTPMGAQGQVIISPDDIDAGSTAGYCQIANRTVYPNRFTCDDFGTHEVTLTITDALGVSASSTTTVTISGNIADGIACNNNVNFSIPDACEPTLLTYDVVLEGGYDCEANFELTIEGREQPFVTSDDVGQTLRVQITDPNSGANCWGNVTVEDKTAPVIMDCEEVRLFCRSNPAPTTEGGDVPVPTVLDCTGFSLYYYDDMETQRCAFDAPEYITRTWVAIGANNMRSECKQQIIIDNIDLHEYEVYCPDDVQLYCNADDAAIDTTPTHTGYPYIILDGERVSLNPDELLLCGIGATYRDVVFTDVCGASQKIYRSWTAFEWCDASTLFNCLQIIDISDQQAPIIHIDTTLYAQSDATTCGATLLLPPAEIIDCSEVVVHVLTSAGRIAGNGGRVPAPGLAAEGETVTYVAVDACGNEQRKEVHVQVEDRTPPQVICGENIRISLNDEGTAQLFPENIDDGSRDNCALAQLEVYRLDSPCRGTETPAEFTVFDCCDIASSPISVVLRVTDTAGNYNECTVNVSVEDQRPPDIICPADKTVNCLSDIADLTIAGQAYGADNCESFTISYTDDLSKLNSCDLGVVERTWTITSTTGASTSCMQRIDIYNEYPFDGTRDITWPADVVSDNCSSEQTPEFTGAPIFRSTTCNEIYATYKDDVFRDVDDACIKILREWRVLDWCQYGTPDTSEWIYYQSIRLVDTTPPIFMECKDVEICNTDTDCATAADLSVRFVDNCTHETLDQLLWEVDLWADGQRDAGANAYGTGQNTTHIYPNGTHRITYIASDDCGNRSECSFEFTVKDCTPPTSICVSGYTTSLNTNGAVIVDIAPLVSSASFDNCTNSEDLRFSFSSSLDDVTRAYNCNNQGTHPIQVWTTDLAGNQSFCETSITIYDPNERCPDPEPMAQLSGIIRDEQNRVMQGVEVYANYDARMAATDHLGQFQLSEIPTRGDYTLTPVYRSNPRNGISTLDLVLMRKHILGLQLLDSPYKIIAADVNNSGNISTLDLIQLRKVILRIDDTFAAAPAWRFIPADYSFADPKNPLQDNFPELYDINNLLSDMNEIDFIVLKTGDLNNSTTLDGLDAIDERTNRPYTYLDAEQITTQKQESILTISHQDIATLQGLQLTLAVAPGVTILDIEEGIITESHFNTQHVQDGQLSISWNKTTESKHDSILFKLKIKSVNTLQDSPILEIRHFPVSSEAYNNSDELLNIAIRNKNGTMVAKDNFVLHQNQPNPFASHTAIGFDLPRPTTAQLTVFDARGRQLYAHQARYEAGHHQHIISATEIAATGILYYQLATACQVQTGKMIKLH